MGNYEELISSSSFTHLLGNINQHQLEEEQQSFIEENNNENKEILNEPINIEIKQEGLIKWNIYTSYLKAGVGLFIGFILIIGIFSIREFISVFSDRWLAKWTDEETHRYKTFNNCTQISKSYIKLMNNIQWNDHRNYRYYIYIGIYIYIFFF